MNMRSEGFSSTIPDRVNIKTLDAVRNHLIEPSWKRILRKIYSSYLEKVYAIDQLGEGFRWGKSWEIKKGVLKVGHFVYIGPKVLIIYPTVIGDLCMIAQGVQFIGNDHGFEIPGIPTRITPPRIDFKDKPTIIESDVWIVISSILILVSLYFLSLYFGLIGAASANLLMVTLLSFNLFVYMILNEKIRWKYVIEDLGWGMFLPIFIYLAGTIRPDMSILEKTILTSIICICPFFVMLRDKNIKKRLSMISHSFLKA